MISSGPNYSGGNGSGPGSGGGSAPTSTWADRPAVGTIGSRIYISDIGEYGAELVSTGTVWAHTGPIEIMQRAKGWISPSLAAADAATYSQSGTTITVTSTGHNIPATNYDTKDVYLNMGTAATGATIPPGWFSNFQRTGADTFTCVSTVSQTGTGSVNTNTSEIFITDLTSTINGGVLGLNGVTDYALFASNNNNANIKTSTFYFGSVAIPYESTTATVNGVVSAPISNRNSYTSQFTLINGATTLGVISQDTSVDFTISYSLQCAAANDYIAIHAASVYIKIS